VWLCGPEGSGKTHLLQAIAAKHGARAIYITSDKFCYIFSAAAHRYGDGVVTAASRRARMAPIT